MRFVYSTQNLEISNLNALKTFRLDTDKDKSDIRLPPVHICQDGLEKMMEYLQGVLNGMSKPILDNVKPIFIE